MFSTSLYVLHSLSMLPPITGITKHLYFGKRKSHLHKSQVQNIDSVNLGSSRGKTWDRKCLEPKWVAVFHLPQKKWELRRQPIPNGKQIGKLCKPKTSHFLGLSPSDKDQIWITGWKKKQKQNKITMGNNTQSGLSWCESSGLARRSSAEHFKVLEEALLQKPTKLGCYLLRQGLHSDTLWKQYKLQQKPPLTEEVDGNTTCFHPTA